MTPGNNVVTPGNNATPLSTPDIQTRHTRKSFNLHRNHRRATWNANIIQRTRQLSLPPLIGSPPSDLEPPATGHAERQAAQDNPPSHTQALSCLIPEVKSDRALSAMIVDVMIVGVKYVIRSPVWVGAVETQGVAGGRLYKIDRTIRYQADQYSFPEGIAKGAVLVQRTWIRVYRQSRELGAWRCRYPKLAQRISKILYIHYEG